MSGLLHQEPGIDLEGLLQLVRKRKTGFFLNADRRKLPDSKHLCFTNLSVMKLHSIFVNYLDLMIEDRHSCFVFALFTAFYFHCTPNYTLIEAKVWEQCTLAGADLL